MASAPVPTVTPPTSVNLHVRAMEAAYSFTFWLVVWRYFTKSLATLITRVDWASGAAVLTALFVCYQLLRMYFILHFLEEKKTSESQFLDGLESRGERLVRLVLAVTLVIIPELEAEDISFPAVLLGVCFVLLLIWDQVVWNKVEVSRLSDGARASFLKFYYQKDGNDKRGRWFKFTERLIGLLAATLASICLYPHIPKSDQTLISLVGFLFVLFLLYLVLPVIGFFRRGDQWEGVTDDYLKPLRKYPVEPVCTIFEYFGIGGGKMFRKAYATLLLTLTLFTVVQCTRYTSSAPMMSIRVATSKNLWCTLTLVAEEKRYFQQEGLDPQLSYKAAGRLNMDALLGDAADFSNVVETNIAYQALNQTSNIAIHSKIVSATDYAILTKASSVIRAPADLHGKHLVYAQATGAESFVFWFLEKEKIPVRDVVLVPLQPSGLVDHFIAEKSDDAVATWEPFVTTIRSRVSNLGSTFQTDVDGFAGTMNVAMRRDYATAHKRMVDAYDRAMEKAARFVAENPAEAQQIMSAQVGLPLATIQAIWPHFDFRYSKASEENATQIQEVVRRIKANVPEMENKQPTDIRSYFAP